MASLIDDMLKLSRVTRHEINEEQIDLSKLAESIANEMAEEAPGRKVTLDFQADLFDTGDAQLMRIALTNLLQNAFKFTSKKDFTFIEFGAKDQNGKRVYFIRDNGAGFDMQYAKKLFGAFQRLHKAEDYPGTGIGLATVQRIIFKHGGRIWAESIQNVGTTFFFSLHHLAQETTNE
jgi:light-regulated signal transduction histidine kinase (bacteriophytochrome)